MSSFLSSIGSFAKSAGGGSVIGSAIGAGGSILSSILGNNSQIKLMDRAADIARKQGDYDREQNYLYQKKQLDDERAYNDPSAQMARYMKAGLNPNLIYGQVNPNAPSIASSLGVSSGVGSPSSAFAPDIAGAASQGALMAAQVRKTNAEADKTESETRGQEYTNQILESDAAFRDAFNRGQLDLQYANVQFTNFNTRLTEEEITKCRAETKNLNIQADVLNTSIEEAKNRMANLDAQTQGQLIDNALKRPLAQAQIKQMCAAANLSMAQIPYVEQQIKNLVLTGESITLGNVRIGIENEQLQFNLESDKNFKNAERAIAGARELTSMITDVVDTFNPVGALGKGIGKALSK